MNRIAIRILIRMLDTLVEQTDEVKYAHKNNVEAELFLAQALKNLRAAKTLLSDLMERP